MIHLKKNNKLEQIENMRERGGTAALELELCKPYFVLAETHNPIRLPGRQHSAVYPESLPLQSLVSFS